MWLFAGAASAFPALTVAKISGKFQVTPGSIAKAQAGFGGRELSDESI